MIAASNEVQCSEDHVLADGAFLGRASEDDV